MVTQADGEPAAQDQAQQAVAFARAQIGKPYVFGTAGPNTYDCSGLTKAAYEAANPPIHLDHWTGSQIFSGVEVAKSDLQLGDLVFPDSGHVVIYSGNNQIIEAPHAGAVVREGPLYGFWRARRVTTDGNPNNSVAAALNNANAVLTTKFDPLDPLGIFAGLSAGETFVKLVKLVMSSPKRIGLFVLGSFAVLIGVMFLMRRPAAQITVGAAQVAGGIFTRGATNAATNVIEDKLTKRPSQGGEVAGHGDVADRPIYSGRHRRSG